MHKAISLEAGRYALRIDIFFQIDLDMIRFPLLMLHFPSPDKYTPTGVTIPEFLCFYNRHYHTGSSHSCQLTLDIHLLSYRCRYYSLPVGTFIRLSTCVDRCVRVGGRPAVGSW